MEAQQQQQQQQPRKLEHAGRVPRRNLSISSITHINNTLRVQLYCTEPVVLYCTSLLYQYLLN